MHRTMGVTVRAKWRAGGHKQQPLCRVEGVDASDSQVLINTGASRCPPFGDKIPTHCISVRGATYCVQPDYKIMTVVTNRRCWMQARVCFCWFVVVVNPRRVYARGG